MLGHLVAVDYLAHAQPDRINGLYTLATDANAREQLAIRIGNAIVHPVDTGNSIYNAAVNYYNNTDIGQMGEDGLRFGSGFLATLGIGKGVTLVGGAAGDATMAAGRWVAPAVVPAIGDMMENLVSRMNLRLYAIEPGVSVTTGVADAEAAAAAGLRGVGATAGVGDMAAATRFVTTESVAATGSRAIDLAQSYETAVRGMYNASRQPYTGIVNGQIVSGVADGATSITGQLTAIEAKFVEDWGLSLRNPASPIGNTSWAIAEQQTMLEQAARYSANFPGGVIYHTNSVELATYYSRVFREAGITNFHFVITPIK